MSDKSFAIAKLSGNEDINKIHLAFALQNEIMLKQTGAVKRKTKKKKIEQGEEK